MNQKRINFIVSKIALVLMVSAVMLLNSCAGIKPNPENPIRTVAMLPMTNITNDVGGSDKVRMFMARQVVKKFYEVKYFEETDQVLMNQFGITLGEMAEDTTAIELGKALEVDAIVYGYLVNFGGVTTGVVNEDRVRAGFKMIDSKTGDVIWQQAVGIKSQSSGGALGSVVSLASNLKDAFKDDQVNKDVRGAENIPGFDVWVINDEGNNGGGGGLAGIGLSLAAKLIEKGVAKATNTYLNPESRKLASYLVWENRKAALPPGPIDKDSTKTNYKAFKKAN